MDSDDKMQSKAHGSRTSSSAISTPKENRHMHENMRDLQSLQEFLKTNPKNEPSYTSSDKERKIGFKCKMTDDLSKATSKKGCKTMELKKHSSKHLASVNNLAPPKKQPMKGENPLRLSSSTEGSYCNVPNTWICKNSACKAVLNLEDTFCRRCSCCICHLFDDNKDPSLWLVCSSEKDDQDWCGSSCHIECAFQHHKVGVVDIGQLMQLDGSYCCASCGKVSGIIGCWKKQLAIAKDARRVDILCYRIFLSYRLLVGTSHFKELHDIVKDAKAKLETEVGPVNGVSAKMARGIVSRLSVGGDVQKLCSYAVEKADEWLSSTCRSDTKHGDSFPAACRFQFEEITSSSLVILLKDTNSSASDAIKGYKLWFCKSNEQPYGKEPVVFPKAQRRILISNLQPCTEYTFRIISFTEDGDLGHSESKCFTKSVEVIRKNTDHTRAEGCSSNAKRRAKVSTAGSSGFKVRNLGMILRLAWAQEEGCYDVLRDDDIEENSYGGSAAVRCETVEGDRVEPPVSRRLDLNVASVPDLNLEVTPPVESSPEDDKCCSSDKNGLGSGDSQTPECRTRELSTREETYDGDSTLVNGSPLGLSKGSSLLDENYEYCVRVIRWLECTGHIEKDFRMKFLTWFSLRSTEQERRVVITFIQTLIEEPSCLAGQLLDSFTEIVSCKRPRNGFCSKLWH